MTMIEVAATERLITIIRRKCCLEYCWFTDDDYATENRSVCWFKHNLKDKLETMKRWNNEKGKHIWTALKYQESSYCKGALQSPFPISRHRLQNKKAKFEIRWQLSGERTLGKPVENLVRTPPEQQVKGSAPMQSHDHEKQEPGKGSLRSKRLRRRVSARCFCLWGPVLLHRGLSRQMSEGLMKKWNQLLRNLHIHRLQCTAPLDTTWNNMNADVQGMGSTGLLHSSPSDIC